MFQCTSNNKMAASGDIKSRSSCIAEVLKIRIASNVPVPSHHICKLHSNLCSLRNIKKEVLSSELRLVVIHIQDKYIYNTQGK